MNPGTWAGSFGTAILNSASFGPSNVSTFCGSCFAAHFAGTPAEKPWSRSAKVFVSSFATTAAGAAGRVNAGDCRLLERIELRVGAVLEDGAFGGFGLLVEGGVMGGIAQRDDGGGEDVDELAGAAPHFRDQQEHDARIFRIALPPTRRRR